MFLVERGSHRLQNHRYILGLGRPGCSSSPVSLTLLPQTHPVPSQKHYQLSPRDERRVKETLDPPLIASLLQGSRWCHRRGALFLKLARGNRTCAKETGTRQKKSVPGNSLPVQVTKPSVPCQHESRFDLKQQGGPLLPGYLMYSSVTEWPRGMIRDYANPGPTHLWRPLSCLVRANTFKAPEPVTTA